MDRRRNYNTKKLTKEFLEREFSKINNEMETLLGYK